MSASRNTTGTLELIMLSPGASIAYMSCPSKNMPLGMPLATTMRAQDPGFPAISPR